jgi:aldehyde:ferredoxin oxidoreductase
VVALVEMIAYRRGFGDLLAEGSLHDPRHMPIMRASYLLAILEAVTGWDLTPEEMVTTAHRGLTLARLFNLREGFGRADDRLPPRFSDPLPKHAGLTAEQQAKIVTDYYVEQGWDAETGVPTPDTIRALGIEADAAFAG